MSITAEQLQERLDAVQEKFPVAGATVAILADNQVLTATTGVLHVGTQVPVTPDSVFQIGSITKVWTAVLVQRFVDRGLLDYDTAVVTYLPELKLSQRDVQEKVTLRHLLTHTSGIDGDHFLDTGRGDDVLERYVASLEHVAITHPLGATMSYCNAGFSLLGRVLERVSGLPSWDEVLRQELVVPLGLQRTVTLPEEALLHSVAVGHVGKPGELKVTPQWGITRSAGPAGLITATAEDVVTFARMTLDDGKAADGAQILEPGTIARMLEPQVEVPDPYSLGEHWGLGWILYGYGAGVYGHDGATLGQNAYLRIVPGTRTVVAVLTNGGQVSDFSHLLLTELLGELAGVTVPPKLEPVDGADGGDQSLQVGTYRRAASTTEVERADGGALRMTITNTSDLAEIMGAEPQTVELLPHQENVYVGRMPGVEGGFAVVFYALPTGERYVHFGARATPKIA